MTRLTNYTRGTGGSATSGSWSLDAEGNWISSTTNGTTTDRTNNAQNQVTEVGGNTLTYDADGNLTTDQNGNTYVYDAWGRLTSVTTGSDTISYTYDALGRRISQTDGNTGITTNLIYSGQQVIQENQSGTPVTQYVWSPFYVNQLIERNDHTPGASGTSLDRRLYAEQDADYDVTSLTNSSGTVVERYSYDPYGTVTVLNANGTVRGDGTIASSDYGWVYTFQGGRIDPISGLVHFQARDLNTGLGRWIEQDPNGYVNGPNVYQFELSSPQDSVDPDGLETVALNDIIWTAEDWDAFNREQTELFGPPLPPTAPTPLLPPDDPSIDALIRTTQMPQQQFDINAVFKDLNPRIVQGLQFIGMPSSWINNLVQFNQVIGTGAYNAFSNGVNLGPVTVFPTIGGAPNPFTPTVDPYDYYNWEPKKPTVSGGVIIQF